MTVTATKIDSSHESGKNFITWAWPVKYCVPIRNEQKIGADSVSKNVFETKTEADL
jgi:hypothetical protein